jgi:uncharacterized protein (DUF885 family)
MKAWLQKGVLAFGIALTFAVACVAQAAQVDPQETKKLHQLFDTQWEEQARLNPEESTQRGDFRFNDQLSDRSPAARADNDARDRAWLAQAKAIRREQLSPQDQVSLDLFIHAMSDDVERQSLGGWRGMLIGSLWGPQTRLADLEVAVPMDNALQVQQLLKRFAAYPKLVDQQIVLMREGLATGWVPAQNVLDRATAQIDKQLASAVDASPWYEPFKRIGAAVPQADRERLQAQGREAIAQNVVPQMRKLRAFIVDELKPKAPAEGALRNYPGGAKVYAFLVRSQTTTSLSAEQVHQIGLRELAALRAEMEGIMRQVKFQGTFAQFVDHLNTDPKFFYPSPEAMLAGYRDIAKRIDPELPRYFAELPRMTYGVRSIAAFRGPDAAEYYDGPSEDGTRPGYFNANTAGYQKRTKWWMPSLTAHESVPGHHLQIARALEMKDLPAFRRYTWYVAYGEGWALYAETVAREMGIYSDPYSLFGHLQQRAFRAARLVVDTGIHEKGWTRQQAIDFMTERTGMNRDFVTSEVDRYTSAPGQALGYMIGALKFKELRERATAKLGDRFDLRRFHNVLIDSGPLPLDVLDKIVDEWIARESAH